MPLYKKRTAAGDAKSAAKEDKLGDDFAQACMTDRLEEVVAYLSENQALIWPTVNALKMGYIKSFVQTVVRPEDKDEFSHNQVRLEDLPKCWVDLVVLEWLANKGLTKDRLAKWYKVDKRVQQKLMIFHSGTSEQFPVPSKLKKKAETKWALEERRKGYLGRMGLDFAINEVEDDDGAGE